MFANIVIGTAVFGYASWAIYRFINRSKAGKCAACSIRESCSTNCSSQSK
ncbi:FeoB-associated Cys-rich membrane protein [Cytobacillus spongiae]|nr:FeoB-associated Cys-rich membrane protein [Cytobacillus spongiae]UII56832.1 FeoB-associated Cys-rich membrane protein [Cytobacillus spongiae]